MAPDASSVPPRSQVIVRTPSATYPIDIAWGAAARLPALLDANDLPARRLVVSNGVVWRLHGRTLASVSAEEPILLPDGERFKNLATVGRIYDALIRAAADRATTVVAVGGGVIGDVAGFAAATYLRGVPLVHVPTTLLAQVDSAIGGKVGVNHAVGKNLIGAFHQPRLVVVDPGLLQTLPRREFRAGLYEVVKYGMIASRPLFERVAASLPALFAREAEPLAAIVAECCRIKADVVERDERETGPRRTLNFGHTVGHALEAVTRYRRFRHGEAVGYGMLAAAALAVTRGVLAESDRTALSAVITTMGPLPPIGDLDAGEIVDATARDKKVVAGRLHFVLPTSIGSTTTVSDVTREELLRAVVAIGARVAAGSAMP
ncbi:MAG TPA: 3-dehydroquinate synthase [Vicinamibacterales bacterium]|nr:3-dehydroquinate synthase [Vicinamibacterales bacterium]